MAQEKNTRNRHTGAKAGAAVVLLAALLAGGRFGLGWGRGEGGGGLLNGSGQTAQPTAAQTQETAAPAPADDGVLHITVREDKIYFKGEEVDLTALEEALLHGFRDGIKVTLEDDHAIKGTYDEVAALLEKLGITAE